MIFLSSPNRTILCFVIPSLLWISPCTAGEKTAIYIGGFFPISSDKYYQELVESVQIAINHVNEFERILPDHELRMVWNWTEADPSVGLGVLYDFIYNKPQILMTWGPVYSRVGQTLNEIAARYNLVQVCIAQGTSRDPERYPLSVQIYPSATVFNPARLKLLKQMAWKRAAIIFQNFDVFRKEMEELAAIMHEEGLQVISIEHITGNPAKNIASLLNHDARIIFGSFYQEMASEVFCEAYRQGMVGPKYLWITLGWYHANWWIEESEKQLALGRDFCHPEQLQSLVEGSLSMRGFEVEQDLSLINFHGLYPSPDQLAFYAHLQSQLATLGACDAYGYDQIITVALALNASIEVLASMHPAKRLEDFTYDDSEMARVFRKQALAVNFKGLSGHVSFDQNGVRESTAVIQQVQDAKVRQIFSFDKSNGEVVWFRDFKWKDNFPPVDGVSLTYKSQLIQPSIRITLYVIVSFGILMALVFLITNSYYSNRSVIKISSPKLNNVIAVGGILLYCSVYLYPLRLEITDQDQIGLQCQLSPICMCIGFSLSFGALFMKTYRIHHIYTSAMKARRARQKITDTRLLLYITGFIGLDILIFLIWNVVDPLEIRTMEVDRMVLDLKREIFQVNTLNACVSAHDFYYVTAIFAYKSCMLLFGVFLAWSTKDVKISQINDSKYIAMSVYTVGITCAIAVPVTYWYDAMEAALDFNFCFVGLSLFLSNTAVLGLVFVPKVKIIWSGHSDERIETFTARFTDAPSSLATLDGNDTVLKYLKDDLQNKQTKMMYLLKLLKQGQSDGRCVVLTNSD